MATKRLFHQTVSGFAAQSMECWYLIVASDGSYRVEHTWVRRSGQSEPDIGTEITSATSFVETTDDVEVLASLTASLIEQPEVAKLLASSRS